MLYKYSKILYQTIPSEWELKQINKIANKRIERKSIESDVYIGIENIETGTGNISGYDDQSNFTTKQVFHNNDLLYSRIRPYLNKIWLSNVEGYCSTDIIVIKTSGYIPNFLKELMLSPEFVNFAVRHSAGTKMPRVNWDDIKKLHVPVPPLIEQRGIVEVLGTVDECIRLTDAVIERAEELKRGLMQQLLTRGIGHTEYKETPIGKIPKTWKIMTIKEVCEKPQYGYTESATEDPVGPKFLRITDIKDRLVNWDEVPYCKCDQQDYDKYKINKNDIVFARTGATTGKNYLISESVNAVFASYLIRLKTKNIINISFLYAFLNSHLYWKQINRNMVGAAQGGVNASTLSNILLPFPKIEEQIQIATIIDTNNVLINREKEKKKHLNMVKKGLIQVLLSGKIRVELKGDGLHRIGDGREANN